jgi:hypothetical protein
MKAGDANSIVEQAIESIDDNTLDELLSEIDNYQSEIVDNIKVEFLRKRVEELKELNETRVEDPAQRKELNDELETVAKTVITSTKRYGNEQGEAIDAAYRTIGENRIDELNEKSLSMPEFQHLREYFEVDMCDDDLKCLNRILVNEELDFIDTENAFLIASFLKSNVSLNGNEISLLKYFTDFCLDERVNNKEVFSILLSAIREKVSDVIDKIETNVKNIELLEIIIFTIILVGLDNLELNEGEYLNILLRILNSNLDSQSYSFIRVLFGNNVMKNNVNKRKIIFEEILKKNGRILALNDKKHIMMDIFCDENMLIMDDIAYRKVVDIIIEGDIIKTYLLEVVMKLSGLTFVKRCLLIEYYCNMIEKNKHIYSLDLVKRMLSQREINIFNIIYCDNLINMDDEGFGCVLKNVVDSNNPLSYLKVFTSSVVNEEQRMLALNLVNQGCTRSIRNNSAEDYNDAVAMAAISPVLVERPIDEYFNMLLRRKNHIEISKRPRPTTVKPITEPAEKATLKPRFSPSRQAFAVLALEAVAIFMPIKPESAEKNPPVIKANGT